MFAANQPNNIKTKYEWGLKYLTADTNRADK